MKVEILSRSEENIEYYDYRDRLKIVVVTNNGEQTLNFHDGEPEDNNLGRNFGHCHSIPALLEQAYNAGKNGEEFEIEMGNLEE